MSSHTDTASKRENRRATRIRREATITALTRRYPRRVQLPLAGASRTLQAIRTFGEDGEPAKPPTVYRALEFLERLGFAHRIESLNAYVPCRLDGESHRAAFLICDCCGAAQEFEPDFSVIFLNHIAHLQHQFWHRGDKPHPEMRLGLMLADAMMEILLRERATDEAFILMNALKQKNVSGDGFHVYRQKNPQDAIYAIGIRRGRVEQCMTHDATILFTNKADADKALELLQSCFLSDGHKAFFVERQAVSARTLRQPRLRLLATPERPHHRHGRPPMRRRRAARR